MTNQEVAKICYDTNRAHFSGRGHHVIPDWHEASVAEKCSAINIVEHFLANPDAKPVTSTDEIYASIVKSLHGVEVADEASIQKAIDKVIDNSVQATPKKENVKPSEEKKKAPDKKVAPRVDKKTSKKK